MNESELIVSLTKTAYTTGAGANCFFQGFIHTLCVQAQEVVYSMSKFPGSQKLIEIFNREVPEIKVKDMNELLIIANAMHPLERELIFGPLMRMSLNELNLKGPEPELTPLKLEESSIIFPPHSIAFSYAFGFSFNEYTHVNDAEGMPEHLKKDIVGGQFYRVQNHLEGNVGTVSLRLKNCHFEVGGLTPELVEAHQSKIQPKVLEADPSRAEQPGARYYEEPSPNSHCAVKSANVNFSDALSNTMVALRKRPGQHICLFKSEMVKEIKESMQSSKPETTPLSVKEQEDTYCGFKPGFLTGKRF